MEGTTTKAIIPLPELQEVYSVALIPVYKILLLSTIYYVVESSSNMPITFNIIDLACLQVTFIKIDYYSGS
uniref:Uncharacterized protein n=1 Tax=Arundo donax TaxID=35708 RepID=A0A0A9GXE2_ARUDO